MNCPKCQNLELENGGPCPVCGYRLATEPGRSDEAGGNSVTLVEQAAANDTAAELELPEWRQELSRRLQEIKSKRESTEAKAPADGEASGSSEPSMTAAPVEPQPVPRRAAAPRRPRPNPDFQERKEPIQEILPALPLSPVLPSPSPEPGIQQSAAAVASAGDLLIHRPARESQDRDIQKLIDSRASRSAVEEKRQPAPEAEPKIEPKNPAVKRPEPVPLSRTTAELPIHQVLAPEAGRTSSSF